MIEIKVSSAEFDRIEEALNSPLWDAKASGRAVIPLDQPPTEPGMVTFGDPPQGAGYGRVPVRSLTIREADAEILLPLTRQFDVVPGRSVVVRVIGWADGQLTVEKEQ